jgi:hypothetical protein
MACRVKNIDKITKEVGAEICSVQFQTFDGAFLWNPLSVSTS